MYKVLMYFLELPFWSTEVQMNNEKVVSFFLKKKLSIYNRKMWLMLIWGFGMLWLT